MRFLQPRRHRTFRPSYLATALAVVGALLIAVVQPHWLDVLFLEASGGMFSASAAITDGADGVRTRLTSKRELEAENDTLREENIRLTLRAALFDEVIVERDRLYARFGQEPSVPGVLARIIAAPSRSPYDVLLIDAGSSDGIAVGDEAWFDITLMLGTVESVSPHAARVRLFSSPGMETHVSVSGTSTGLFTAMGVGGGAFELSIPKDIAVEKEGALILPSEGHGALGFIKEITTHDTDSFQTVRAILPINLFETRELVIRPVDR